MRRLTVLFTGVLIMASGCATTQRGQWSRSRTWEKKGGVVRLYDNGSHPRIGRLPRTDVPLAVNDRVVAWIDYFTRYGENARFGRHLERSGRYLEMMRAALRRHGLPQDLVYIALIESGFQNTARSHAAAVGTWQFIQSTARGYGLDINSYIDERRDPEKAVDAAARYLKTLYEEFGDWYLAMAGYNAGEGRVRRAIAQFGTKDFWSLASYGNRAFRAETREYVPKYIAATIIAKDPKRFGFAHLNYHEPWDYDRAKIQGQTDLAAVADAAKVSLSEIEELNPEVHSGVTPPGKYEVRLPVGRARTFGRRFATVARKYPVESRQMLSYRVRRGDTLQRIARRYGLSPRQLLAANRLRSARYLRAGQVLAIPETAQAQSKARVLEVASATGEKERIGTESLPVTAIVGAHVAPSSGKAAGASPSTPQCGWVVGPRTSVRGVSCSDEASSQGATGMSPWGPTLVVPAPEPEQVAVVPQPVAPARVVANAAPTAAAQRKFHRVRRGDTLGQIAKRYQVRVTDLRRWNAVQGSKIRVGQRLYVEKGISPRPAAALVSTAVAAVPIVPARKPGVAGTYRVRRGDSLYVIARRYGMTVRELKQRNGLTTNQLRAGERLIVSGPVGVAAQGMPTTTQNGPTALAERAPQASPAYATYVIKSGDTLGTIAREYGMTVPELRRINQLGPRTMIRAGKSLKVVDATPTPETLPKGEPVASIPTATTQPVALNVEPSASQKLWSDRLSLQAQAESVGRQVIYQVKPGDTLWDISKTYNVSPAQIQDWNNMDAPSIKPGQKLTIRISS
ncbi:MAG: LysM peptidoglycan-binding domain-containing protein [Deltaproteobacteria bacterium]|nr:LysM peptidoglycan-binding domain-containing protein [Deltaproteobacteria bacterium]